MVYTGNVVGDSGILSIRAYYAEVTFESAAIILHIRLWSVRKLSHTIEYVDWRIQAHVGS